MNDIDPKWMTTCVNSLDTLLVSHGPIVSCLVVAPKQEVVNTKQDAISMAMKILGVRDMKSLAINLTFAELGLDSLTTVEMGQSLERDFKIFLPTDAIRKLTFSKLKELSGQSEVAVEKE